MLKLQPGDVTGWCTRCGGDCLNDVRHRCPPKRREADAVIRLKSALYNAKQKLGIRVIWPPSIEPLFDEVRAAIEQLEAEL